MHALLMGSHAGDTSDIILHADCESRAVHGRSSQTTVELRVEVHGVLVVLDGLVQQTEKLTGGAEQGTTLRDGDMLRFVPREFLDRADEALVRALGAFLGKGRLIRVSKASMEIGTRAYAMRNLHVLDKHNHLLLRDETLEVLPRLLDIVGLEFRVGSIPKDTAGKRIEILHELALAGQLNIDGAITETAGPAFGKVGAVALNGTHGVVQGDKFDVSVHGLASDAVHDDMDWLIGVVQDFGVAAEEGDDLCALRRKRDLWHACEHKKGNRW